MLKALMKKQFRELGTLMVQSGKKGKRKSKISVVLYIILFLYVFGALAFVFTMLSDAIYEPLHTLPLGWLYFALMGTIATLLAIFGSVFATYATLYHAKDNELLLSMPIPVWKILFVRMSCVYITSFVFEVVVLLPAIIVHWVKGNPSGLDIVLELVILIILPLLAVTLSCFLGWVAGLLIGLVGKRFRNFVIVLAFVVFMALYYYVATQAYQLLPYILKNLNNIVKVVKIILFPLYHMGHASGGNLESFIIMLAVIAGTFLVTCVLLSKSFFHIAATKKGDSRAKFEKKKISMGSISGALLRKELLRFTGSATYMLNSGLGTVIMVIAAVFVAIKADWIQEMLTQMGFFASELTEYIPIFLIGILCLMISMNMITAPSVSLEGKNIWILQVMPLSAWQILREKLKFHILVTGIPALICAVCAIAAFQLNAGYAVICIVTSTLYVFWCAELGLALNLKLPNLNWTNEASVVKQGLAVLFTMLGSWAVLITAGVVFFFVRNAVKLLPFLAGFGVLLLVGDLLLYFWLKGKGCQHFDQLQEK